MRRMNGGLVLDTLRDTGPLAVTDLVARTRLSRPTVDAIADDLVRLGFVSEVDPVAQSRRGRPARRLAFRAEAGYVAGLDIGEAKVRTAVADLRGDVIAEVRHVFAQSERPGRKRLDIVRCTLTRTIADAGIEPSALRATCVGCSGGMDYATGAVLFSGAFPGLRAVNLREEISPVVGDGPVYVDNDANLAAIGERWLGVARGVDDVICVLASERMGAGIVVGGGLVRGHAGAAGEMAFLGAYEQHHGAEGIAQLARTLAGAPDADTVFAAARADDAGALAIVERSLHTAGRAIVTMALVLNPELVVIAGGVSEAGDILLTPLRRRLANMARLPPRIELSTLGARVVLLGAVRHALDRIEPALLDGLLDAA
jgi:predicted NBD/HSP70 family sugar kinase